MNRTHALPRVELLLCLGALALSLLAGCAASADRASGGGGPANDNTPDDNTGDDDRSDVVREIEEADIIKQQDGYLYLANSYRGFRIIDVRAIERPFLAGGLDVGGRAVELFVRNDRAFMITAADFFYCAGQPVSYGADNDIADNLTAPGYTGSRLVVFDITEKEDPTIVRTFPINGFVTATRRVGDVIYIAGNELAMPEPPDDDDAGTNGPDDGDTNTNGPGDATTNGALVAAQAGGGGASTLAGTVFVQSISIVDPDNPEEVDFERVAGEALQVQASTRAVYIAGDDPDMALTTRIVYVDISDPAGDIEVRDVFRVPGVIFSRFFMDEYGDTLRIITEDEVQVSPFQVRERVALYNYDISDPSDVDRRSRLLIDTDELVTAVRFDGPRAYVVTLEQQVSNVAVVDLSDPDNPEVAGEIKALGLSTHIIPLGDRLLTVGYDGRTWFRPALALYDVSRPHSPVELSRVSIGDLNLHGVTTEATFDEKALRVLENEQLVLIPYSYFDDEMLEYVDSLQIVDLLPARLRERGKMDHRGLVRRAGVLDERLWVLSDVAFQTLDIDDRDDPISLAEVDIISEQELLDAGLSDCVDSARFRSNPGGLFVPGGLDYFAFTACGAMGVPALALFATGWTLLRLRARRRL